MLRAVVLSLTAVGLPWHLVAARTAPGRQSIQLDVPFVATPQAVVEGMLTLAHVTSADVVYDLGCGDGRIVITAAKEFGARGVGVDKDPARIADANRNAEQAGVADRVTFRVADLFETDVHEATVVTLYLLPSINERLRPMLQRELRPGSRIVSNSFLMGDWTPSTSTVVDTRHIYLWIVGGHD